MVNVSEKLEQGYIQSKVVIEIVGKPKEHVEEAIKKYLDLISKKEDIDILEKEIVPAKELENDDQGLFAIFAELEILTKDITVLMGFCFDYMPSSIEIIEPKEMKLKERDLTGIMNDLQGKLHKLDMGAKQLNNENQFLKQNAYFLATNLFAVLMKTGSRKLDQLSRLSGMSEKDTKEFLEKLIKQGHVKKEGEEYFWQNNDKREKQN